MNYRKAILSLRLSLAFVWIFTGVLCIGVPAEGRSLIERAGIQGIAAERVIQSVSAFEILLGVLLIGGLWPRTLAVVQIVLIVIFTGIVTLYLPEFWLHPFGPISKNIVLIAAAAVAGGESREVRGKR